MRPWRFVKAAAYAIPHRDKAAKGGEDAFFLSPKGTSLGVADGVGGWVSSGVDVAVFTRNFFSEAYDIADQAEKGSFKVTSRVPLQLNGPPHAHDILVHAHERNLAKNPTIEGSCTAITTSLHPTTNEKVAQLSMSLIGDCGAMVIRGDRVIFRTVEQQQQFNFPYQVGPRDGDALETAMTCTVDVADDDIVVLGSDGYWDNVHDFLTSRAVSAAQRRTSVEGKDTYQQKPTSELFDAEWCAKELATMALTLAGMPGSKYQSPFVQRAMESGIRDFEGMGGKEDDITVVVAQIGAGAACKWPTYGKIDEFFAANNDAKMAATKPVSKL